MEREGRWKVVVPFGLIFFPVWAKGCARYKNTLFFFPITATTMEYHFYVNTELSSIRSEFNESIANQTYVNLLGNHNKL